MIALEVHDATVVFGGRHALTAVDFTAAAGSITGLIGPNGAGKTTLFNVICGLQRPDRGQVWVNGADVTRRAPFKRARLGLARTFQRLELFGLLTVRDNVRLAAQVSGERSHAPADRLVDRLGLGAVAEVRSDRLPTGQARMVELARALATRPKVLLLDEPASGQSEGETAVFATVLREVADDGVAVVLVEHDVPLVMDTCNEIHVLDLGRVIRVGTPAEVQGDEAVVAAYLGQLT